MLLSTSSGRTVLLDQGLMYHTLMYACVGMQNNVAACDLGAESEDTQGLRWGPSPKTLKGYAGRQPFT